MDHLPIGPIVPTREIYARITITAEQLEQAAATDRALDRRLQPLSEKLRAKAWRRIQGHRWGRIINAERAALIADLSRATYGPWASSSHGQAGSG